MTTLPYRLAQVAELTGHDERVWHVAWNPARPLLASCSSDKTVRLYHYHRRQSPTTGAFDEGDDDKYEFRTQAVVETGHTKTVRCVAWAPSGATFLTTSFDSETLAFEQAPASDDEDGDGDDAMRVDEGEGGREGAGHGPHKGEWECMATLEGHESEVKSVSYSASGTLVATCGRDKTVYIWEVKPDCEFEIVDVKMEHTQDVKCVAWHPSEEILASGSYDDTIKLYKDDPDDDFYDFQTLRGHASTVWALAWAPGPTTTSFSDSDRDYADSPASSLLASASDDRTIRIWARGRDDRWRWEEACVIEGAHERSVYSVSWARGDGSRRRSENGEGADTERDAGWLASAGGDGRVNVWQIWERAPSSITTEHPRVRAELIARLDDAHGIAEVNCVAWCPREPCMLVTAGDDGVVRVWRMQRAQNAQTSNGEEGGVKS